MQRLVGSLPWPLPAVLAWAMAWVIQAAARPLAGAPLAFGLATLAGLMLAWPAATGWRRAIGGAGFPLSAAALGAWPALPSAWWLGAALPLALVYPLRAWRDAPFFPTPADALLDLGAWARPAPRRVLDAGCGLGHGLAALRALWPDPQIAGIEWSRPLAWAAARRCRFARVTRGDMWAASWAGHDLVYVFQRPESMARVWAKARADLAPGAWLVSLEFEVPGVAPTARLHGARPVWLYRVGTKARTAP
jgi:SAM-dependent methyltransferase